MYVVPPKFISMQITNVSVNTYWTQPNFSNDKFARKPYRWQITATVFLQSQSYQQSKIPFSYSGQDIAVGGWICSGIRGLAHQIISISNASQSSITMIVEDVDRFNTVLDASKQGNGAPIPGAAFYFEVSKEGLPVCVGANQGTFSYNYITDLESKFRYRNYIKNNVRVYQEGNTLKQGDVIYLDTDGLYKALLADKADRDNLTKIVGTVTDVTIPGTGYFTYSPRGEYMPAMTTILPDAAPGSLIYLDDTVAGGLTATAPKVYATPIYIRLNSSTEGIYLMGGSGSGSSGPLGYNASTYVVDTIDDRDAIDTTLLNIGDQVYVLNNGDWELFLANEIDSTKTPPVVTWTEVTNKFANESASGTTVANLTYQTSSPYSIVEIKNNVRVLNLNLEITEAFSTDAELVIGDDLDNNRLVTIDDIDLTLLGKYSINTSIEYSTNTILKAYITPGASSSGKVTITISYL